MVAIAWVLAILFSAPQESGHSSGISLSLFGKIALLKTINNAATKRNYRSS
jgi:hypothetical protein